MNVLRWCPFVHLFDTLFQNSPYGHELRISQYSKYDGFLEMQELHKVINMSEYG